MPSRAIEYPQTRKKANNKLAEIMDKAKIMFSAVNMFTLNKSPICSGQSSAIGVSSAVSFAVSLNNAGTIAVQNVIYGCRK